MPVVHQVTRTDCGLACLVMILGHHGRAETLAGLRQKVPGSTSEVTLRTLFRGAAEYGLSARAVRARLDQLDRVRLPAILHWDFNHFVVLEAVHKGVCTIVDPARGRLDLTFAEVSERFTGVALEFSAVSQLARAGGIVRTSLADLWTSATGFRRTAALVFAVGVSVQLLLLAVPLVLSVVIDRVAVYRSGQLLSVTIAIAIAAVVLAAAGEVVRRWLLVSVGTQLNAQISLNFVTHLLRLPFRFFQERRLNDMMSRVDSIRQIKDTLVNESVPVVIDGLFSVTTLVALALLSPRLAAVSLTCAAVYAALRLGAYGLQRRRQDRAIDAMSSERGSLMETVRGIQTIKVLNAESSRISDWHGANTAANDAMRRQQELVSLLAGARALIAGLDLLVVVLLAMDSVIAGAMTVGVLFALVALRQQFQDRAYGLIDRASEFGMLRLHLDRLSDVTLAAPETTADRPPGAIQLVPEGRLVLEGIGFRYAHDTPWILRNLDLVIEPGEFVALSGPSGGGKTTLARLMLGLAPPDEGRISVDGVVIDPLTVDAYRASVAAVLQDDQLFTGTLLENIAAFDQDIDVDRVEWAAQQADIHDDILRMGAGYYSRVGDMGSTLSGGQKQRVLLARALYRRPRILFLDEGTANLDAERERRIIERLSALGVTLFCIAHRSATLQAADRVLELRDGQLLVLRSRATPSPQEIPAKRAQCV